MGSHMLLFQRLVLGDTPCLESEIRSRDLGGGRGEGHRTRQIGKEPVRKELEQYRREALRFQEERLENRINLRGKRRVKTEGRETLTQQRKKERRTEGFLSV